MTTISRRTTEQGINTGIYCSSCRCAAPSRYILRLQRARGSVVPMGFNRACRVAIQRAFVRCAPPSSPSATLPRASNNDARAYINFLFCAPTLPNNSSFRTDVSLFARKTNFVRSPAAVCIYSAPDEIQIYHCHVGGTNIHTRMHTRACARVR